MRMKNFDMSKHKGYENVLKENEDRDIVLN